MAEEYKSSSGSLTTTSLTSILTTPADTKDVVRSIYVGNVDATLDSSISIAIHKDGDAAPRYLIKTCLVPIQSSFQVLTEPLVLEADDILKIQAADADCLDYCISYLRIT